MEHINLESGMSKLYELQTELSRSIENMNKLSEQYDVMLDIVEKSGREKDLPENFMDSIKEYKDNLSKQLPIITTRLGYVKILISLYEKQDKTSELVDQIVSLAFAGIGLSETGEDAKVDETKENEAE